MRTVRRSFQRDAFNLADALAGDVELLSDLFEGLFHLPLQRQKRFLITCASFSVRTIKRLLRSSCRFTPQRMGGGLGGGR